MNKVGEKKPRKAGLLKKRTSPPLTGSAKLNGNPLGDSLVGEIEKVLATAESASELTGAIFGPGALVSQLAPTRKERESFVDSPICARIFSRLNELHAAEEAQLTGEIPEAV